jgi:hypothetical protein
MIRSKRSNTQAAWQTLGALAVGTAFLASTSPAEAKKGLWRATRVVDPITGATTCTVAAYDKVGPFSFSQVGGVYPIVEMNDRLGLLVGVSSGGTVRLPTGDIFWRVDDKPFREIKAADNPALPTSAPAIGNGSDDPAANAMAETVNLAMRLATTVAATSTLASGGKAQEMLAELLAGKELIYRQAAAAPAYGLPNSSTYAVGWIKNNGTKIRPYPLDETFRAGLAECGIVGVAAPPAPEK